MFGTAPFCLQGQPVPEGRIHRSDGGKHVAYRIQDDTGRLAGESMTDTPADLFKKMFSGIRFFHCHPMKRSVSIHARRDEPGPAIQIILQCRLNIDRPIIQIILRCRFMIDDHEGLRFHRIEKSIRRLAAGDGEGWTQPEQTGSLPTIPRSESKNDL